MAKKTSWLNAPWRPRFDAPYYGVLTLYLTLENAAERAVIDRQNAIGAELEDFEFNRKSIKLMPQHADFESAKQKRQEVLIQHRELRQLFEDEFKTPSEDSANRMRELTLDLATMPAIEANMLALVQSRYDALKNAFEREFNRGMESIRNEAIQKREALVAELSVMIKEQLDQINLLGIACTRSTPPPTVSLIGNRPT